MEEETPSEAIADVHPGLTSFILPYKTLPSIQTDLSTDMSFGNLPRVPDHGSCREDSIVPDVEEEGLGCETWHSIRGDKMTMPMKEEKKRGVRDQWPGEFDIWSSIISQNRPQWSEYQETTLPPPYVHPLVRRSNSCLSDKSLEICTESLGSESGSDCFSPFPLPGMGSDYEMDGKHDDFLPAAFSRADIGQDFGYKPSIHARPRNKERPRSFPPPLPSLSPASDGTSVQMRSRREDGRLVLEAVSVPYQKNFHALRENGRLMLMLAAPDVDRRDCDEERTGEVECGDGDDVEEERIEWIIGEKAESRVEIVASSPNTGKLEIPKIAIVINNPDKVREVVFFKGIDGGEMKIDPLPIKAAPLNLYEYLWRTISSATPVSAVPDPSETPPPDAKEEDMVSRSDRDLGWIDQRKLQFRLKDTKSMEDCWVSVMKDRRRRSIFFPGGATLHCHVMT